MKFNETFNEYLALYTEAKEAPKGKHYDSAGRLQSGDADSDGRGGPKYRSDPTYENPNEDAEGEDVMHQIHKDVEDGAEYKELIKKFGFDALETYAEWSKAQGIEDNEQDVPMDTSVESRNARQFALAMAKAKAGEPAEDGEGVIDKVADGVNKVLNTGKNWKDGTVFKVKPAVNIVRRGAKIANRVGAETLKSGINMVKAVHKGATEDAEHEDAEINDYDEDTIADFASIDFEFEEGKTLKEVIDAYGADLVKKYIEYMTEGEEVEDCESCGCSDEEVEDCETCGCEENPEYGHFNDKFSDYIDQYEPEEDAERVDKDRMK